MPLLLLPQGGSGPPPTPVGVDITGVIADLLPALGATSLADLTWCTATELFQWSDEAAKRLAHRAGVFVEFDSSASTAIGVAVYNLPASHLDTLHLTVATANLREASVRELLARDNQWQVTTGTPQLYSMDAAPVGTVTLYPAPIAVAAITLVFHRYPAQIASGAPVVAISQVLRDYFTYSMLAEARRKESDAAMEEMAGHFDERVALFEQVIEHLFGPGQ